MFLGSANWPSGGRKVKTPILVQATMQAAVVVVTVRIVLLSILLVLFPGIKDNLSSDGENIVVIGNWGGIICGSADVMITI